MKKIKYIAASLAVLMSLNCQVLGANMYGASADYNPQKSLVTVSGNAGAENAGKWVQMIVLKPYEATDEADTKIAYTLEDLTETNSADLIFALRQAVVGDDGGFSFEYKWNEDMLGGNFQYKFAVQGDSSAESDRTYEKYFMSTAELEGNLEKLLGSSVSDVIETLEEENMGIDTENEFYKENKTAVAQKYIDLVAETGVGIDDLKTEYKNYYETAIFYSKADSGELTAAEVVEYFENREVELPEEYLGNDEEDGTIDSIVSILNKNKTDNLIDDETLLNLMAEYNVLTKINGAGRSELSAVLEDCCEILGLDGLSQYTYYSKLNNDEKIKANIPLTKDDFYTVEDFEEAFKKAVASYKEDKEDNSSSGSSGGGGGGGRVSAIKAPTMNNEMVEKAEEAYKKTFADIEGVAWAKAAIESFAAKGYVSGVNEDEFAPNADITRAEFVKILVNVMGIETEADVAFEDCSADDWYYDYVKKAVGAGIVNGVSETVFGADSLITRQDMCVMVQRAAAFKGMKLLAGEEIEFADGAEIAAYAQESVAALAGAKIINGKGNGKFEPNSRSTRAEAVVILHRLEALKK